MSFSASVPRFGFDRRIHRKSRLGSLGCNSLNYSLTSSVGRKAMPHQVCTRIDAVSLSQNQNEVSIIAQSRNSSLCQKGVAVLFNKNCKWVPFPNVYRASRNNPFDGGFQIFCVRNNSKNLWF
jgi:hypothetical protein